ncbi:MAG: LCP family protein [Armatimonadetes bacterium]|nr:LCP family protein [Armatimonadota bacterium]
MDIHNTNHPNRNEGLGNSQAQSLPLRQQSVRAQKIRLAVKRTLLVGTMIVALFGGTVFGKLYWGNKFFKKAVDGLMKGVPRADLLHEFQTGVQFPEKHILTVLLLGCDHDYSEVLVNHPLKGSRGRSDAIMIARLDLDNKTINILSIPRDTAVRIEKHGTRKINSAHQYGGPELVKSTIKSVFGIDVDYYTTIDFEAFQKMVDAVGGVDVEVHKRLKYDDNWGGLHIDLYPGLQHLDGYKAMGYVRMRHSDSDFERAKRQHEFLEALRGRVTNPLNFNNTLNALNTLTDSIKTDMSVEQMMALANFARSLPRAKVHLETLPCLEGPSYVYIKVSDSEKIIRELFPGVQVSIEAPSKRELERMPRSPKEERERDDKDTKQVQSPSDTPVDSGDNIDPRADEPTQPENSTEKKPDDTPKEGGKDTPPKPEESKPKEEPKKDSPTKSDGGTAN